MSQLAITKEVRGSLEQICERVISAITPTGFGILTRIDFDKKLKEKLDVVINPCVVLGACHPGLAYEAYKLTTDVALLIPCNIVLTEKEKGIIRVEAVRPSQMLQLLPVDCEMDALVDVEKKLEQAILGL